MSNRPELLFLDALAASGAVYVTLRYWFTGSLFSVLREYAAAWQHLPGWRFWLGSLLSCPLCLSFWLSVFYTGLFLFPLAVDPNRTILRAVLYGLALTALFNPGDFNDDDGDTRADKARPRHESADAPDLGGSGPRLGGA